MRNTKPILLAALAAYAMVADAQDAFRWELKDTGESKTYSVKGVPEKGTYSVRLRAALMDVAKGGVMKIVADGVALESRGAGFMLSGSKENLVIPGQLDEVNFDFTLRNRCYREFVFICAEDRLTLFGEGDEKRPILKHPGGLRGFELTCENADLDVKELEFEPRDMTGVWTCRNMLINGGMEELVNGYAPYWTTGGFGFDSPAQISDLKKTRECYHIDSTVAWEGTNSMFLASKTPFYECWRTRPAGRDYVFSIYAKSDKPGSRLILEALEKYRNITNKTVELTSEWKRYEVSFNAGKAKSFRCGVRLSSGGCAWVDAAQVEVGTNATPFVARRTPQREIPPNPPKVMDFYYTDKTAPKAPSGNLPRMAKVDPKRNSFRFGDKEYFFYGFVGLRTEDTPEWRKAMDLFAAWGMNMTSSYMDIPPPEVFRPLLDESERRGIKTRVYLRCNTKEFKPDEKLLGNLKNLKAVIDHPNLLMIDMLDETYGRISAEDKRKYLDLVRKETGNKIPLCVNECDYGVINHADYSAADVAMGDFYVIGTQHIGAQYYVLKQLRDENPDSVIGFYPMCTGHFAIWNRDATPAEIIAQAYNGYVLEVFNICWWYGVPLSEVACNAVAQGKRERDLIDPSAFLDGTPVAVKCASRNDAVKFSARKMKDGITRIIALNIEERANDAEWTLPETPAKVKALIGKDPDCVAGNTIHDKFGPLERRVYDVK